MYKRRANGWLKHWDFILIDLIVIQVAYVLSLCFAGYTSLYETSLYRNIAIILEAINIIVILVFSTFRDVLKKGHYLTFISCLQQGILIGVTTILYLFAIQEGQNFSRLTILYTSLIYVLLSYICREFWKNHLLKFFSRTNSNKQSLLIITDKDNALNVIEKVDSHLFDNYTLTGISLFDHAKEKEINNIPIVCTIESVPEFICKKWVDEVLIVLPKSIEYPKNLINKIEETGVVVHVNIPYISSGNGKRQFVEDVGGYTVLTTAFNYASPKQLLVKRIMDICAGIIGCLLTAIIFIFVAPIIYINSPGPIFYTQERIGRNGKPFKMYKFRSMYLDADERKAELMKENKIKDGRMFKMDFDPRIIGNKILPDGTKKTGIGEFIRKTSLDEFPQFYNVLKGDMSLVGTRPPLESEVSLYELHHHARLAVKPGITGMWQVSGRSNITDFEEVVKLDKEYINNWCIGLDIKIIFKTILVVFKKRGIDVIVMSYIRKVDKSSIPTCNIMGVNIAAINMKWLKRYLKDNLQDLKGDYICVSNVHTTVTSYEDENYRNIQNNALMAIPDGGPLSSIGRKRGFSSMSRTAGPSLMEEIFQDKRYAHYFYGSTEKTLELLEKKLKEKYPNIKIVGMYSPPFRKLTEEEDEKVIEKINNCNPDFVWIGLGAPKQEIWMAEHQGKINGLMIGVGAGFDYFAENIKRAPLWMQKSNLEWLYRLIQDPKRLFKRYFVTNTKFIWHAVIKGE